MPNAISAVGTQVNSGGTVTFPTTINVNPSAVGNMIALAVVFTGNNSATAISGGNCTWTLLATSAYNSTLNTVTQLWMGVAAATGSAAITLTTSGASGFFEYQEFAGGGAGTPWSLDGTQAGGTNSTAAVTSVAYPTLVPSGTGRLYWGYDYGGNPSGVTSGYTSEPSFGVFAFIYDTSVSTSQSPVVTQASSAYQAVGALVYAGSSLPYPNDPVVNWQDLPSSATALDAANLNEESAAIQQIQAFLPSMVASVIAADGTITMGGTSTARTVAVNTIAQSQVTGLVSALAGKVGSVTNTDGTIAVTGTATAPVVSLPASGYTQGGPWVSSVYGNQFENMERDDATSGVLMSSRTLLVLLGWCPASIYSTFKVFLSTIAAGTAGTISSALFSAATLTNTSWTRLGSGNVTMGSLTGSPAIISNSLAFTLASPAFVVLEMVATTAWGTTQPTFAAGGAVPAGLLNPTSGCPVLGTSSNTTAPGSTLNPTTGFTAGTQKVWCALA